MSRMRTAAKAPRSKRIKAGVTAETYGLLRTRAKDAGMTLSRYVNALIEANVGLSEPPRRPKNPVRDELLHTLNNVFAELCRIGRNVNQLARQANTGMVPLSRQELEDSLSVVQMTAVEIKDALEELA